MSLIFNVIWNKYKKYIILGVLAISVLSYIWYLKYQNNKLHGIVSGYKVVITKSNIEINRLLDINNFNMNEHNRSIQSCKKKLEVYSERVAIQTEKESEYIDIIDSLRNQEPVIIKTKVYELEECEVIVKTPDDLNGSGTLYRLNKSIGGL